MKRTFTPIELMVAKQRIGDEEANRHALPVLLYLDAAHRGQGCIAAENALVRLVLIVQVLGSKSGNRALYDIGCKGGQALFTAAGRGAELLAFTTGEYQAMRKPVNSYLRVLPGLQILMLTFACGRADELIAEMRGE